jgi:hypothetical protein
VTEIHDNVLSTTEIKTLLDWFHQQDELVDDRRDIRSKSPLWSSQDWPQALIKKVLDRILSEPYRVELVWFAGSRISLPLHVDSGDDDDNVPYKNIIIPLYAEGPASTVIFDNHWPGAHTRFSKTVLSPFVYSLPDRNGHMRQVDDIRQLLDQCQHSADTVEHFVVDNDLIQLLERLVKVRSGNLNRPPDGFVADYSRISNYRPDTLFDTDLHSQHLSHVPIESLHGLTVETVAEWQPGQAITYDRSQLHSAGSGHTLKIGISIFTYR